MTTHINNGTLSGGYRPSGGVDTFINYGVVGGYGLKIDHFVDTINKSRGLIDGQGGADGISIYTSARVENYGNIYGYSAIFATNGGAPTITNIGTIKGFGQFGNGVFLSGGGEVVNDYYSNAPLIYGKNDGVLTGELATVLNGSQIYGKNDAGVQMLFGSINNLGYIHSGGSGAGIEMDAQFATVVNTYATGGFSFLSGYVKSPNGAGVEFTSTASTASTAILTNLLAAIHGGAYGVEFAGGGSVTNSYGAVIEGGRDGVRIAAGGVVTNIGTIEGNNIFGVVIGGKGTVSNSGLIKGFAVGLDLRLGVVDNLGSIEGYEGVSMGTGRLTNGSASDHAALISGQYAVEIGTGSLNTTVTNFGSILGGAEAVRLGDASDVLAVEAGSVFIGAINGDGGTLDLDSGTGALEGLFTGANVVASVDGVLTTFGNFGRVEIGPTASFVTSGAPSLAAGQTVIAMGALTIGDKSDKIVSAGLIETLGGTIVLAGKVSGKGSVAIDGGLLHCQSTFGQNVAFTGATGTLELAKSQTYKGTVSGFSTAGGEALDLDDIGFTGSGEATYSGSQSGGTLTVSDGTHTANLKLSGDYRAAVFTAASDGHGGVLVTASKGGAVTPPAFVAAMAGLGAEAAAAGAPVSAIWREHAPPMLIAPRCAAF